LGRMTPTELPIRVNFSADISPPQRRRRLQLL
jgi:hypothetical protein